MTPNHDANRHSCWRFYTDRDADAVLERRDELNSKIAQSLDDNELNDPIVESIARINSLGWMTGLVLNDLRENKLDIKKIWKDFGHIVQGVLNIEMMDQN